MLQNFRKNTQQISRIKYALYIFKFILVFGKPKPVYNERDVYSIIFKIYSLDQLMDLKMTAKQIDCQSRALDKQIKQCENKCQQVY